MSVQRQVLAHGAGFWAGLYGAVSRSGVPQIPRHTGRMRPTGQLARGPPFHRAGCRAGPTRWRRARPWAARAQGSRDERLPPDLAGPNVADVHIPRAKSVRVWQRPRGAISPQGLVAAVSCNPRSSGAATSRSTRRPASARSRPRPRFRGAGARRRRSRGHRRRRRWPSGARPSRAAVRADSLS
jgi:hypothetical protein